MGSYDYITNGSLCGQVKCWGKGYSQYNPGCRVLLHRQLSESELAGASGGSSSPSLGYRIGGHPMPSITHYQVPCSNGMYLIVVDSIFTAISPDADPDLPMLGNDGRAFDPAQPRTAWLEMHDAGSCPSCEEPE